MDWNKKDVWTKLGTNFTVEVKHWKRGERNMWNVYAYIGKEHPHFSEFISEELFQPATEVLHFHWGVTFCKGLCEFGKEIHAYQVGSDYAHCYDEPFESVDNRDDAYEVFQDAEILYKQLEEMEAKDK